MPIVSQEAEQVSGYCNIEDPNITVGEYLCFGDHSEHIKYINHRFVQGADGLKILKSNNETVWVKYLFYASQAYYRRHDN
jgi:type I restriction enzyme S subunit